MTTQMPPTAEPVSRYPNHPPDLDASAMFNSAPALTPIAPAAPSPSLFAQLHQRYPGSSLISELLQVYEGSFVVRVVVQVDGTIVATGLAAATAIEVAEDRARLRALEVLEILALRTATLVHSSLISYESQPHLIAADQAGHAPASHTEVPPLADPVLAGQHVAVDRAEIVDEFKPVVSDQPMVVEPVLQDDRTTPDGAIDASIPSSVPKAEPTSADLPASVEASDVAAEPEVTPKRGSKPPKAAPIAPSTPDPLPELSLVDAPIDLSDAIAQIGTEIERIGWNKKQGSAHLQKTYGKRTRAELTEEELLEFLSYLKSLPSKTQPTLSPVPF
jgi:hypothetical protein